jgi:hypothetical protein
MIITNNIIIKQMSTYSDVQNSRTAFVNAIGDNTTGYLGNYLLKAPLHSFTSVLNSMDQELTDAGGADADVGVFDTQIADYAKMLTYIEKITNRNIDEQIHEKGEDFYFYDVSNVTQASGTTNVKEMTDVILLSSRKSESFVETTGITTTPTLISTYVTPSDYAFGDNNPVLSGICYIELHAEKTVGDGDLGVYFEVDEVSSDGTTSVANITSGTITEARKKDRATIIPATYGRYKVYLKIPQKHTMASSTNRMILKLYAYSSTGTVDLKYYTNGAKLTRFRSTMARTVSANIEGVGTKAVSIYRDSDTVRFYFSHIWTPIDLETSTAVNIGGIVTGPSSVKLTSGKWQVTYSLYFSRYNPYYLYSTIGFDDVVPTTSVYNPGASGYHDNNIYSHNRTWTWTGIVDIGDTEDGKVVRVWIKGGGSGHSIALYRFDLSAIRISTE